MNLSNQRIFEVLSRDEDFYKYYLNDYLERFLDVYPIDKNKVKEEIINFYNNHNLEIYPDQLLDLANKINKINNNEGYRNSEIINKLSLTPVKHNLIFSKLYSLLDCYRSIWKDLEILEKESFLHLNLMKIYPFVDNNELICNLILTLNLINNYYSPIIITKEEKELYYLMINSGDALKFKKLLEHKINLEMINMIKLYKNYYLFPDNITIEEIIIQKTNY